MLPLKALWGWGDSFLVSPSFWWWPTMLGISRCKAVSCSLCLPCHMATCPLCVSVSIFPVCVSVSPFPLSFLLSGPTRVTQDLHCIARVFHCGARTLLLWHVGSGLAAPRHVGSYSFPGIEPMSSALQGRFLTTGPPGKCPSFSFLVRMPYENENEEDAFSLNIGPTLNCPICLH